MCSSFGMVLTISHYAQRAIIVSETFSRSLFDTEDSKR